MTNGEHSAWMERFRNMTPSPFTYWDDFTAAMRQRIYDRQQERKSNV